MRKRSGHEIQKMKTEAAHEMYIDAMQGLDASVFPVGNGRANSRMVSLMNEDYRRQRSRIPVQSVFPDSRPKMKGE